MTLKHTSDSLKLKLEEAQIPSNYTFLQTKKTNPKKIFGHSSAPVYTWL